MGRRITIATSTLAGAVAVAVGCGLDPGGTWNRSDTAGTVGTPGSSGGNTSFEDVTDQLQGVCPATSALLQGSKTSGDTCTSPSECVATCCDCPTGSSIGWLSASCVDGRCTGSSASCTRTRDRFCGDAGIGTVLGASSGAPQCGTRTSTTACDKCIDANCCAEQLACTANAACNALVTCDAPCTTQECRQRCYASHAAGATDLNTLDACAVAACGAACNP